MICPGPCLQVLDRAARRSSLPFQSQNSSGPYKRGRFFLSGNAYRRRPGAGLMSIPDTGRIPVCETEPGSEHMSEITLANAEAIIDAIFEAAVEKQWKPMAVAVTNQGGNVIVFKKQDDSSMLRFEMASGKCYGALALGRSTSLVRLRAEQRPLFMDYLFKASDGKIFAEDGGMLVRNKEGALLGAVGVTGERPERDEELAALGIRAAGFLTDDDAAGLGHHIRLDN